MLNESVKVLVLGAGVGGLGAGSWLKRYEADFSIYEGSEILPQNLHNGVHYLHSNPSLPFDFDFREITLSDGVLGRDGFEYRIKKEPELQDSLNYSEKVREIQHPSSIMDIGKRKTVFVPKSNDVNDLLSSMYKYIGDERFNFGWWLESIDVKNHLATLSNEDDMKTIHYDYCISTLPLRFVQKFFGFDFKLNTRPIYVTNFKVERIVPNWMINIYIPSVETEIYRASILNGILSVESTEPLDSERIDFAKANLSMFHIVDEEPEHFEWKEGKIDSISIDERERLLEESHKVGFYPVGRFSQWNRKLLMDSTIAQAKEAVEEILKNPLKL